MLTRNELERPIKSGATHKDAYERFLKMTQINKDLIAGYSAAAKPFLSSLGLKGTKYINHSIIIFFKNGEKVIYQFNVEEDIKVGKLGKEDTDE